jgi:hypothetical protein
VEDEDIFADVGKYVPPETTSQDTKPSKVRHTHYPLCICVYMCVRFVGGCALLCVSALVCLSV